MTKLTNPDVSVVIPTHGGSYLAAAVSTVVAQTMKDWELVIVDDRPGVRSASVLERVRPDPRIRVVSNEQNLGIVASRNRGLASIAPSSRYIAFLDHDDIWVPRTLEVLLAGLTSNPSAVAVHGRATIIDEGGQQRTDDRMAIPARRMGLSRRRLVAWPEDRPTQFANLVVEDCIVSMGSGLIRRSAIDRIGGFDPRAERTEDYDFWIRLSRIGPIAFVGDVVLGHRQYAGQTSNRRRPPRGSGLAYVRYKMIASPENTPEQRRLAVAGFRARQTQLLAEGWAGLGRACIQRDAPRIGRHLVDVAGSVAAYARGRPWSWHR